jgi:hypothetical protein
MVSFEGEGDAVVPTPSQDVDRAPVSPHRVSILGHFLEPEVDKDLTRKSEVDLSSEVARNLSREHARRYREKRGWALRVLAVRGSPEKFQRANHFHVKEVPHVLLADQRRWADFQAEKKRASENKQTRQNTNRATNRTEPSALQRRISGGSARLGAVGALTGGGLAGLKTPTPSP